MGPSGTGGHVSRDHTPAVVPNFSLLKTATLSGRSQDIAFGRSNWNTAVALFRAGGKTFFLLVNIVFSTGKGEREWEGGREREREREERDIPSLP